MKLNFFSPLPKRHRYFIWDFWIKKHCSYYPSFPRLLFGHCNKFRRGTFLHKNAISFFGLDHKNRWFYRKNWPATTAYNIAAEFFEHSCKRKLWKISLVATYTIFFILHKKVPHIWLQNRNFLLITITPSKKPYNMKRLA